MKHEVYINPNNPNEIIVITPESITSINVSDLKSLGGLDVQRIWLTDFFCRILNVTELNDLYKDTIERILNITEANKSHNKSFNKSFN